MDVEHPRVRITAEKPASCGVVQRQFPNAILEAVRSLPAGKQQEILSRANPCANKRLRRIPSGA
jgi:hypothetical protein